MTYKNNGVYNTVCPRDCYGVCSLKVTIEDNIVTKITGNNENINSEGRFCAKGASYAKRLYHPDRITHPLLKDKISGEFEKISWESAYDLIIKKLNYYKDTDTSESIMYLSGWGHTGVFNNYANSFWSQFARVSSTYGSLCMAGGKAGVRYTYGNSVKHNINSDLEKARLIILWGANPANTNIHRMRNIRKACKNGAKLVVIDPRVSESMIDGSIKIHPRPGSDALLAFAIAKLLIGRGICDYEFINDNVIGFELYKEHLQHYDFNDLVEKTNVSLDDMSLIADLIEENPLYALVSGTGKSRYTNAGQTERAISSLPALTGSIGKSSGGFYFTDGQQASIKWPFLPEDGYQMKNHIHVGKLAYDLSIQTPEIKMMWIEKANPITSSPDVNELIKAFSKLDFIVTVEHFMSDTAAISDLILPSAMFSEKNDLHCVYGDSYIHLLQKLTPAVGLCKSEAEIYRDLGEKMGMDLSYLPVVDEKCINQLLSYNNIDTSYEKLSVESYLKDDYRKIAFEDLKFDTPSGKIELYSEQMKEIGYHALPSFNEPMESKYSSPDLYKKYPLHFLSAHSSQRINSQFKEMNISGGDSKPRLQINPIDAFKRRLIDGDTVEVYNERGHLQVICQISDLVMPGLVHMYEGWGEEFSASINKLSKGRDTDFGNGTAFHDCLVEVSKKGS